MKLKGAALSQAFDEAHKPIGHIVDLTKAQQTALLKLLSGAATAEAGAAALTVLPNGERREMADILAAFA